MWFKQEITTIPHVITMFKKVVEGDTMTQVMGVKQ